MAIVKVIEVLAQSDKSWEDATQQALAEAKKNDSQHPVYLRQGISGHRR
jgi:flavin-binding protein dodecin